jgi:hypothetical protein
MLTKGKMTKALNEKGIRTGDKDGAMVQLEHLKTYQITKMYYEHCTQQND